MPQQDELAERQIARFLQRIGLADLEPEAPGRWRVVFDGDLGVDFLPLPDGRIALEADLGPLPEDEFRAERLLRELLNRQLGRLGDLGAPTLFFDPVAGILRIRRVEKSDGDDEGEFAAGVERFTNAAEWWLESISAESSSLAPGLSLRP
jgi:hypothetical protein